MTTPYITSEAPAGAPTRGERPTGSTILAVFAFLGAGFAVLGGIMTFAMGSILGSAFGGAEGGALGAAIGGFIGFFFLIGAAVAALMGYGHWTGAGWAWVLQLVFSGLSALSSLWSVVQGDVSAILGLVIPGIIIWYLLQPNVKRWYGRA